MFTYSGYTQTRVVSEPSSNYASGQAARASSKANSNEDKLRWLEDNLSRTLLICEALWEIVRDEKGWTDDKIIEKIDEIDLRDGVLDGKNKRDLSKCASCGRNVSPRHKACIYCGKPVDKSAFSM